MPLQQSGSASPTGRAAATLLVLGKDDLHLQSPGYKTAGRAAKASTLVASLQPTRVCECPALGRMLPNVLSPGCFQAPEVRG